jgi:DNA transformation protein
MAVQAQYLAYVLEQLSGLQRVSTRRMFGGVGLYSGALFFGLIDDDTLFFKTDASNYAGYEARRMPRFMPPANRPLGPTGYHQVPADIIEEGELLVAWARQSVAVALASRSAGGARKPRAGGAANKTGAPKRTVARKKTAVGKKSMATKKPMARKKRSPRAQARRRR